MQPDNNPNPITTPGSTPPAVPANEASPSPTPTTDQPTASPEAVPTMPMPQKPPNSKKKLIVILVLLALLLAGGVAAYWILIREKDEPEVSTSQTVQEPEPEASKIPEGFTEYNNETEGISFIYPESWGDVVLVPGPEEKNGHLIAGSEKLISFSANSSIQAGVSSKDRQHNDMGHDGMMTPGVQTLDQAKEVKQYIKTGEVYIDTSDQFAYVLVCGEFCSQEPRIQLSYTFSLPGNEKYNVIQFHYNSEEVGPEYYMNTNTDKPTLDEAEFKQIDPTTIIKKTDKNFLEIQKIADYITSQTN